MKQLFYCLLFLFLLAACTHKRITLETLLMEMADRETLARFPYPAYTLKQFSSYDRATINKDDPS
jgi:hypothetical protein